MKRKKGLIRVHLMPHSVDRWHQYVSPASKKRISGTVSKHLHEALKTGIELDYEGAGHIEIIKDELWAVVLPSLEGGWKVITFHRGESAGFREYWSEKLERQRKGKEKIG